MTRRGGFTIVELIITITIMAILMTLAVVSLRSTQANGRDAERTTDIEEIARSLETLYSSNRSDLAVSGRYAGSDAIKNQLNTQKTYNFLPDINQNALRAPGVALTANVSLIAATNTTQTTAGVLPQPTKDTYVYQPLARNATTGAWSLCVNHLTTECRKFNIYYRLESDNTVQMITSKNQ